MNHFSTFCINYIKKKTFFISFSIHFSDLKKHTNMIISIIHNKLRNKNEE